MATQPTINKRLTKVNFTDSNRTKEQIKYLVKHYVGATGGAEDNCKYFENKFIGASAHFFVGHDGEIWQCVEEADTAWHCGATSYKHNECRNSNSIGIELCVKKDKNGKWYYTDATKKAAVKLFAYLMDKYDIDVDHVLRHYDVTGKTCGEPDVRNGNRVWSTFKKDIAEYGKKGNSGNAANSEATTDTRTQSSQSTNKSEVTYLIQTTCDSLNIRAGAGTNYPVVGVINEKAGKKNTYTITEEKNGFGKLKSGTGWISLSYTEKVSSSKESGSSFTPYLIETTCDVLNIRSKAGINNKIVGTISEKAGQKKQYTIAEEKNGWGKLKSGAGWIKLSFTKKVS